MLSDAEFLEHKAEYHHHVVTILNQLAEQEASVILSRHRGVPAHPLYRISDLISREINRNYTRFFPNSLRQIQTSA